MKKALIDPSIKPGGTTSRKGGVMLPRSLEEFLDERSSKKDKNNHSFIKEVISWFKSK